jgi:hypothetical protein
MEFNVSPGAIINAGGGFLFLLVGIAILVVARQTRLGRRLGLFAASFGLAYALANILLFNEDVDSVAAAVLLLVPGFVPALCLGFLIVEVARDLAPPAKRRVALLAAAIGLAAAVAAVVFVALVAREVDDPGLVTVDGTSVLVLPLIWLVEPFLLVLLAAASQPETGEWSLRRYKGRMLLGLAAGLFAANIVMVTAAAAGPQQDWTGPAIKGAGLLLGVLVACTAWMVLQGRPPGTETFARRAFVAIVVVGVAGCLQQAFPETEAIGLFGIIRTVGAVLLVLAVVKYDVLGVPLPRLVVRRGVLAGGALAVLFIVAQVAQNFFSAKYGLLMGGVLAGTFVFAASPIQRAIERSSDHRNPNAGATAGAGYKAAVRAAMRDGMITRREERHLAEVAVALGISPVQALDLRDEVEREHA